VLDRLEGGDGTVELAPRRGLGDRLVDHGARRAQHVRGQDDEGRVAQGV
jgi:hypothetical protein